MKKIYFDNNATTAISDSVFESMLPFLREQYGNPSSVYSMGSVAKKAIELSRNSICRLINATTNDVIFTSGGSESNCTAIMSYINSNPNKKHIICSPMEHYSILSLMNQLEKCGFDVDYLPLTPSGSVDLHVLPELIKDDTLLVIVMLANNETGVINNVHQIKNLIPKNKKIYIHTDAVQAVGKMHIDVQELNVDSLSISGHKFHAPKGVGALYYSTSNFFNPLIPGHQEGERRGGTENVASIVGIGQAAIDVFENLRDNVGKMKSLQEYFENRLISCFNNVVIFSKESDRLCNTTNFSIRNIDGTLLMLKLAQKGIYVSTGSACNSEEQRPSRVLTAMGVDSEFIKSIRVSFSEWNTFSEVDQFMSALGGIVN